MSDAAETYDRVVVSLRERRRAPGWKAEEDRPLLESLERLYDGLTPQEQASADQGGWKGWPDLYDDAQERCRPIRTA